MDIKDKIKDRIKELKECQCKNTKIEYNKRFGKIIVCLDCDTVVNVLGFGGE